MTNKTIYDIRISTSLANNATGSTGARRYPLSFVLSGHYSWNNGQLYTQDVRGHWWTATTTADNTAYDLRAENTLLLSQSSNYKVNSFTLRCISVKYSATIIDLISLLVEIRVSLANDATGSTSARRYPLSFVLSGVYYWYDGKLHTQKVFGHWWSLTVATSNTARDLRMDASSLNSQYNDSKLAGYALRCVLIKPNNGTLCWQRHRLY